MIDLDALTLPEAKRHLCEFRDEIDRLRTRCNPSKVIEIGDVGHYVSEAVYAEIDRLREEVAELTRQNAVLWDAVNDANQQRQSDQPNGATP